MASVPDVGAAAPDFVLPDTYGTPVELRSLRGAGGVLVIFVPFAFSSVCTQELSDLREAAPSFWSAGIRSLVVSTDTVYSLRAWSQAERVSEEAGIMLLSDFWPHGAVAREYGVLDEGNGMPVRASFLLDADGMVRWSVVNDPGRARSVSDYAAAIDRLAG